jgi:hypothetical protein
MTWAVKESRITTRIQNHGSGELNPADGSYLNEFRIHEGVDTSYANSTESRIRLTTTHSTKLFLGQSCPMLAGPNPGSGSTLPSM